MTDRMVPVSLVARLSALLVPAGHAVLVPQVLTRVDPDADVPTTVSVLVELLAPHNAEALCGPLVALFGEYRQPGSQPQPASPVVPVGILTVRESQILAGIARGLSSHQLGRELGVSTDTVKSTASRMFRKLGVGDRAHAVAVAYKTGLLPVDRQVA